MKKRIISICFLPIVLLLAGCRNNLSAELRLQLCDEQLMVEPVCEFVVKLLKEKWEEAEVVALSGAEADQVCIKYWGGLMDDRSTIHLDLLRSGMAGVFTIFASQNQQIDASYDMAHVFVRYWPEYSGYYSYYYRCDFVFIRIDSSGHEIVDRIWPDQELFYGSAIKTSIY